MQNSQLQTSFENGGTNRPHISPFKHLNLKITKLPLRFHILLCGNCSVMYRDDSTNSYRIQRWQQGRDEQALIQNAWMFVTASCFSLFLSFLYAVCDRVVFSRTFVVHVWRKRLGADCFCRQMIFIPCRALICLALCTSWSVAKYRRLCW